VYRGPGRREGEHYLGHKNKHKTDGKKTVGVAAGGNSVILVTARLAGYRVKSGTRNLKLHRRWRRGGKKTSTEINASRGL